jgi:hypothetical protein
MLRGGACFTGLVFSPRNHFARKPMKDPYPEDAETVDTCESSESDCSTIKALKTTVREFDAIFKAMEIEIPLGYESEPEEVVEEDDSWEFSRYESSRRISQELSNRDRRTSSKNSRRKPRSSSTSSEESYQSSTDKCWDPMKQLRWIPRWWCKPPEQNLHYMFVRLS